MNGPAAQRIGNLLRHGLSVGDLLGIQSQFLRYSKWAAKIRGIDIDAAPERYFRAWSLRGTMHVHDLLDYPLYMHEGNRSAYMDSYWNDSSVMSPAMKRRAESKMMHLIESGVTGRKDIIRSFREQGLSSEAISYLFNAWGGMPRILMEHGEIIQTVSDRLSYVIAPKMPVMTAEQAEMEQMRRYLENYAPCSVNDAEYFFRYGKAKTRLLVRQCVDSSSGKLRLQDGGVFHEADCSRETIRPDAVHVLPGFDPLLVGYEKRENPLVPPEYLRNIFNLQGIIRPVILLGDRCVAVWTVRNGTAYIRPFVKEKTVTNACMAAEKKILALSGCKKCQCE